MSPEQARGKPVDERTDIWAFGCVLYEMLTSQRAFDDEDVSLTLSKVLQREPDLRQLPAHTPGALRKLVQRCLNKNVKDRLQAIGDARILIQELTSRTLPPSSTRRQASGRIRYGRSCFPGPSALILGAGLGFAAFYDRSHGECPRAVRVCSARRPER